MTTMDKISSLIVANGIGRGGGVECHARKFCFCADGHLLDAGGEISMSYNTLIQEKY